MITNWLYQLQDINVVDIHNSKADLVVIDYSHDGSDGEAFTSAEVDRMQAKPKGEQRKIVAYLSIGEAETYRYYWRKSWDKNKDGIPDAAAPSWLGKENPDWEGNYKVRYWNNNWQSVIYGTSDSYLDKIIAAGFDGAYLDIVDAYEYYQGKRATAAQEMIEFVGKLSAYAKSKNPNFLIIPQNAEGLLKHSEYLEVIDGISKEDLFYGLNRDGIPNPRSEINWSKSLLEKATNAGKFVLTVDYVNLHSGSFKQEQVIQTSYHKSQSAGFIPLVTGRDLDYLSYNGTVKNNKLQGGKGNDRLYGLAGNDLIRGSMGNDYLVGGVGNDKLIGGRGNDVLVGGKGDDLLKGNSGSDRFVFATNTVFRQLQIGIDQVIDFVSNEDKIVLNRTTFDQLGNTISFASVSSLAAAKNSTALITYISSTGALYYNQNSADPGFGMGGKFADFQDDLILAKSDFI